MPIILRVKRTFVPVGDASSQWEQVSFSRVVWYCERGGTPVAMKVVAPAGYLEGTLAAYIDSRKVDALEFDEALREALGITRSGIEQSLKEAV